MSVIQRTATGWKTWSEARRREAELIRRTYLRESRDAADLAVNFGCSNCNPMITVQFKNGKADFSKPSVIHELSCTAKN